VLDKSGVEKREKRKKREGKRNEKNGQWARKPLFSRSSRCRFNGPKKEERRRKEKDGVATFPLPLISN